MANDLQSLAHTRWNCKYHISPQSGKPFLLFFGIADGMIFLPHEHYGDDTMLVKRCFFSAFGDGIMQMIRV